MVHFYEISTINCDTAKNYVDHWFKKVLVGKINYIKQVKGLNDLTYLSFAKKLNEVFQETIFDLSALKELDEFLSHNTFIIEYSHGETHRQGSGFILDGIGLFTSHHVTEDGEFYNVYKNISYPVKPLGKIGKPLNEISSNKSIDYALYKPSFIHVSPVLFKVGDSRNLNIGDKVIVAGYPEHQRENSPYVQTCKITSKKPFHGSVLYTVSGRIVHGSSGGVALNEKLEVIGIIKGGISSLSEDVTNENQGFVPIHLALDHIHLSNTQSSN